MNFDIIKEAVKKEAEALGIKEYELYYYSEENLSVETLKDEISAFSSGMSGSLSFNCIVDGKMGYASTELVTVEEVAGLVSRAAENARYTEKEDTVGIFAGSEAYGKPNSPEFVAADAATLKSSALELQRAIYAASDKVTDGTQSSAVSAVINTRLINSYGLDLSNRAGVKQIYAMPVIKSGEESQESFEVKALTDELDLAAVADKAVETALKKLGAGEVETGKYDLIISAKPMRSILSVFSSAFSAKQAQLGLSLLAGKEGEQIASEAVTITDDPMREGVAMQTPFDGEGVATYRKSVIENGKLVTLLHNRETAKKAGTKSTGNAARGGGVKTYAFCIEAGEYTEDALRELVGNGIYITEVKGLHAGANAVTGDFSIESAGFMIENGKLTRPVKSFTVAGNFFELLKSVSAVASNLDIGLGGFTVCGSPDVFAKDMSVAGK